MIAFIKAIPQIIAFMLAVKKFIDREVDIDKREVILKDLTQKVKDAHEKEDSKDIENLFNRTS